MPHKSWLSSNSLPGVWTFWTADLEKEPSYSCWRTYLSCPPTVGLYSLWNSQALAAPPMWFRLSHLWVPVKILLISSLILPSLTSCPGWWRQHSFSASFYTSAVLLLQPHRKGGRAFLNIPLPHMGPFSLNTSPAGPWSHTAVHQHHQPHHTWGWKPVEPSQCHSHSSLSIAAIAASTYPHQVPPIWLHRIITDKWWIYHIRKCWTQFYS